MPSEVNYINEFLESNYKKIYSNRYSNRMTVKDFLQDNPYGTFLITMKGHITCAINGCVYDTFDPGSRIVWDAYRVK